VVRRAERSQVVVAPSGHGQHPCKRKLGQSESSVHISPVPFVCTEVMDIRISG
jgi:hypothetical protein